MQKKLIALAVAGLASTAAFAQSNVTMYGIVDVGYGRIALGGKDTTTVIDNGLWAGSRLGFKGEEALGNGMTAVFVLEYMLEPDVNGSVGDANSKWTSTASRNTYAGIKGNFGTFKAGRLQGVGYNFACSYNNIAGNAFDPYGGLGAQTNLGCGSGGRTDNSFAWESNNMGGFTLGYNHARKTETAVTTGDDSTINLFGADYTNGPIKAGFAYSKQSNRATAAADDLTEMGLGMTYDFGKAKLFAAWQRQKVENMDADKKFLLGVNIPVSAAGTVMLGYGDNKIDSTAVNDDSKGLTVAYVHNLSKRTKFYGGYKRVSNDGVATKGIATGFTPVAGDNASFMGVGVNHSF